MWMSAGSALEMLKKMDAAEEAARRALASFGKEDAQVAMKKMYELRIFFCEELIKASDGAGTPPCPAAPLPVHPYGGTPWWEQITCNSQRD